MVHFERCAKNNFIHSRLSNQFEDWFGRKVNISVILNATEHLSQFYKGVSTYVSAIENTYITLKTIRLLSKEYLFKNLMSQNNC